MVDRLAILSVIPGRAEGAGPDSIRHSAAEHGFRVRSLTLAPRNDERIGKM